MASLEFSTETNLSNQVYQTALRMLARREHSEWELKGKLTRKFSGDTQSMIAEAIERLQEDGLLSDLRFTQMLIRSRTGRGYGPIYIQQELSSRGIPPDLIESELDELQIDWRALAQQLLDRRHPHAGESRQLWQKAARFLQRRGFPGEVVRGALGDIPLR